MGRGFQTNIVNATTIDIDVSIQYSQNDNCFGTPGAENFTLQSTAQSGNYYSEIDGCYNGQALMAFSPVGATNSGSAMIMYDGSAAVTLPGFVYFISLAPCLVSSVSQAVTSIYPIIALSTSGEWTLATITFYLAENVAPTPAQPS